MEDKYYKTYQAEDLIAFGILISGLLFLLPATVFVGWMIKGFFIEQLYTHIWPIFTVAALVFGLYFGWLQVLLTFFTGLYIEIEGEKIRTWNVLKNKLSDIDLKEVEKIYVSKWAGQHVISTRKKKYLVHIPQKGHVEVMDYIMQTAVNCKNVDKRTYELLEKHRRGKL